MLLIMIDLCEVLLNLMWCLLLLVMGVVGMLVFVDVGNVLCLCIVFKLLLWLLLFVDVV